MSKRTKYSKEFKTNAVKMVTEEGRSVAEVTRELGLSKNQIYLWKKQYLQDPKEAFPGNGNLKSKDEYIRKLELENQRLKQEREILKKATQLFAREP